MELLPLLFFILYCASKAKWGFSAASWQLCAAIASWGHAAAAAPLLQIASHKMWNSDTAKQVAAAYDAALCKSVLFEPTCIHLGQAAVAGRSHGAASIALSDGALQPDCVGELILQPITHPLVFSNHRLVTSTA